MFKKKQNQKIPKEIVKEYNSLRECGSLKQICFVPNSNIFFSTKGYILACCYNTKNFYGKYPEKKISEIWFSKNRKKLIEHVRNNDLSYGCQFCEHYFKSKQFRALKPISYDKYYKTKFSDYPKVLEFEISNNCNLSCIMCSDRVSSQFSEKTGSQKNFNNNIYDEDFVRQIETFIIHAEVAKFFGGEPFLIPLYYKIWERILEVKPDLYVYILTNGTIFNEKIANFIKKGNVKIFISLDSLKKDLYESIRVNASFEQVIQNIQKFYELSEKNGIGLSFIPMNLNCKELPDIINFANTYDADVFLSFLEYPKSLSLKKMSSEELNQIIFYFEQFQFPDKTPNQKHNKSIFEDFIVQLKKLSLDSSSIVMEEKHEVLSCNTFDFEEIIEQIQIKFSSFIKNRNLAVDELKIVEKIKNMLAIEKDYDEKVKIAKSILELDINQNIIEEIQTKDEKSLLQLCKYYLL